MITERFRIPQRTLLSTLFMLHGRIPAIVCGIAVAALIAAAAATADVRWAICSLMVVFIVAPMTMAFLYISYALDPECAYNALPHTLEVLPEGIRVTVYPKVEPDKGEETPEADPCRNGEDEDKVSEEDPPVVERMVAYSSLGPMSLASQGVLFMSGRGFLFIPRRAFSGMDDFNDFVGRVSAGIMAARRTPGE